MTGLYSNILKYGVLPIADKAMKTSIASSYREIKKLQRYSPAEINKWQYTRMTNLIEHAYNHTRYYKNLFKKHRLIPADIKSFEDLRYIPILTKTDVRKNFDDLISDNIETIPHKKSATGGSTGDPMKYWLDHRSWSMLNANTIINWEKVGYNYGDPYIALGSTSLFVNKSSSLKHQIYYRLKNKIGLNGINMSDEVCGDYIAFIRKKKIRFIYGYASSIYLLAKYAIAHNQQLNIQACFPTSEVLKDQFWETINQAFACEIMDGYGASDSGINAFSNRKCFFEVGYNCLVRTENADKNGIGPALITDLFNYAMPFINYKIGDIIQIDAARNKDYPYNGQVINTVLGRTSDIIQLENGRTLTGPGFTILFKDLPVEHYRIEKNDVNSIKCIIVKLPEYQQQHEDIIRATFYKQMGENAKFSIDYTDVIPLTKSGKREYFKKQPND
jgi:phenylacetate-CoA ligase